MAIGSTAADGSRRVVLTDGAGTNISGGTSDATAANQVVTNTELGIVTETAPATDTASSGLNGRLQRIAQRLTSLIALLPASIGVKLTATSLSVTTATDDAIHGALTETAPATDTASSGFNGRLQRIAQRLTSLIAQIPATLGVKTAAASMSITIASDDAILTSSNPVAVYNTDSYVNITTKTTTVVKSGAGTLVRIVITPGTTDTLTIYDNTAASGTVIGTITVGATSNQSLMFGCAFATGLTVVSGGGTAGNYTVIYR